jgi:cytidine deaminase
MPTRTISSEDRERLAQARAVASRSQAPAPARSGALAVTADGSLFPGIALQLPVAAGLSVCAEQVALCGARAGSDAPVVGLYLWLPRAAGEHPCGRCLQVWRELAPACPALLQRGDDEPQWCELKTLLPDAFTQYEAQPPSAQRPPGAPGARRA